MKKRHENANKRGKLLSMKNNDILYLNINYSAAIKAKHKKAT